jgi:ArsR family transcriptional regulator, lead/cadmium/zinc/bismuth-responsive transcriptional repressor
MANPMAIARDTCDVPDLHPDVVRAAREALLPLDEAHDLAEIFSVLADPTRVRIVQALAERELCVCDLANVLRLRQSTVSHQLRLLRALRVVRFRKEGRVAYYALDDEHIARLLAQGLEHVREPLAARRERRQGAA